MKRHVQRCLLIVLILFLAFLAAMTLLSLSRGIAYAQTRPLSAHWQGTTLTIDMGATGCLWLRSPLLGDTWLTCGESQFVIARNYLDYRHWPDGKQLLLVGYDGRLLAALDVPPSHLQAYLPVVASP